VAVASVTAGNSFARTADFENKARGGSLTAEASGDEPRGGALGCVDWFEVRIAPAGVITGNLTAFLGSKISGTMTSGTMTSTASASGSTRVAVLAFEGATARGLDALTADFARGVNERSNSAKASLRGGSTGLAVGTVATEEACETLGASSGVRVLELVEEGGVNLGAVSRNGPVTLGAGNDRRRSATGRIAGLDTTARQSCPRRQPASPMLSNPVSCQMGRRMKFTRQKCSRTLRDVAAQRPPKVDSSGLSVRQAFPDDGILPVAQMGLS
jgi:hypothetical protein